MNQVERIKLKLRLAKSTDLFLEVFGADSHKYIIGNPLSTTDILLFEKEYSVKLPECYVRFLTEIGNGGINHGQSVVGNSAAGPDYGIFCLGHPYQFISDPSLTYLQKDALITAITNQVEWDKWYDNLADNISDEQFEQFVANVYSGVLQIGYSGCSGFYGIILNGTNRGQVIVTYDEMEYCPHFVKQTNFLNWYENWLDEIISGKSILRKGHSIMSESQCLTRFLGDDESYWKFVSLSYIKSFDTISSHTIHVLWNKYKSESDSQVKKYLLTLIVKFDYDNSKELLLEARQHEPLLFLMTMHLYMPQKTGDWIEAINIIKRQNSQSEDIVEYIDHITIIDSQLD